MSTLLWPRTENWAITELKIIVSLDPHVMYTAHPSIKPAEEWVRERISIKMSETIESLVHFVFSLVVFFPSFLFFIYHSFYAFCLSIENMQSYQIVSEWISHKPEIWCTNLYPVKFHTKNRASFWLLLLLLLYSVRITNDFGNNFLWCVYGYIWICMVWIYTYTHTQQHTLAYYMEICGFGL